MYHPKGQNIIRIKGVEQEKKIIQRENIISTTPTYSFHKISSEEILTPKISDFFCPFFTFFFVYHQSLYPHLPFRYIFFRMKILYGNVIVCRWL